MNIKLCRVGCMQSSILIQMDLLFLMQIRTSVLHNVFSPENHERWCKYRCINIGSTALIAMIIATAAARSAIAFPPILANSLDVAQPQKICWEIAFH